MLPGSRQALRKIGADADVVTYLGEYTRRRLQRTLGQQAQLVQLTPGVDVDRFSMRADGSAIRQRYGLTGRPVVVCVSRLVARKGQDALIRALPAIREQVPEAALLIVGRGKYEGHLRELARRSGVSEHVIMTGGVEYEELPAHFAAGDVFAMPCRTRRFGMDVEGLGIVFLEASAVGLPVVAGDSGGAPDAVQDGRTGLVVDGTDVSDLAATLVQVLAEPEYAKSMGRVGRAWVEQAWQWGEIANRLSELLEL
jgi:phosphatidylinositol alpha-1,6-mannosyltransferase